MFDREVETLFLCAMHTDGLLSLGLLRTSTLLFVSWLHSGNGGICVLEVPVCGQGRTS